MCKLAKLFFTYYLYFLICLFSLFDTTKNIQAAKHPYIVSLAPNITEMLFFLGAGDHIVGITRFCNYPPKLVKSKSQVGDLRNPNIEKILALKPDKILLTNEGNSYETYKSLKTLKLPLVVLEINKIQDVFKSMHSLVSLIGLGKKAINRINEFKTNIQLFQKKRMDLEKKQKSKKSNKQPKPLSVLWVYSINPLIVAGPSTFVSEIIYLSGGNNIVKQKGIQRYPRFSMEKVISLNPDVIIHSIPFTEKKRVIRFWRNYKILKAVSKQTLFFVDPDIVDRPGPRLVKGITEVEKLLKKSKELM